MTWGIPVLAEPGPGRVYLDVPYWEKDAAKANGARWDSHARRWYDPCPHTPALQRWAARPDLPEVLAGEDRSFGQGLFVDLVASSCWFTNVRSCVTDTDWERLRRPILRRADHRCEACGHAEDRVTGRGLEVHERWHYDHERNVQSLRRLIARCPACHVSPSVTNRQVNGCAQGIWAPTHVTRHAVDSAIDLTRVRGRSVAPSVPSSVTADQAGVVARGNHSG
jgi:hypothetical protein